MSAYLFGRSLKYLFTPLANGEPIDSFSIVSARLYRTKPSETQRTDPNSAPTVGSAVTSGVKKGKTWEITFPPIADDSPTSPNEFETYFIVVNYKFESGGPTVFTDEVLHIYRPDSIGSRIKVSVEDVYNTESRLRGVASDQDILGFIKQAKEDTFNKYRVLGKEQKRLFNLDRLNSAVRLRATALACLDRFTDDAPHWYEKYKERKEQWLETIRENPPGYDNNATDEPSPDETIPSVGAVWPSR